jgi:hypothetical protein
MEISIDSSADMNMVIFVVDSKENRKTSVFTTFEKYTIKQNRLSMKKILFIVLLTLCQLMPAQSQNETPASRWSEEKAEAWYARQPWLVGCNYIPAKAINQIEMWRDSTFDAAQIDKELGWAHSLGFNTLRVFLSSVVYAHDPDGLKNRMKTFLHISKRHHIKPMFVFFDDCWNEESTYGPQPAPKTGVHNSGWLRDPSVSLRSDTTTLFPQLEKYVKDILTTFRNDHRILMWDLYNEPGNSGHSNQSLPLLRNVFKWAKEVNPSQPVSSGVWYSQLTKLNHFQLTHSDIITYHDYQNAAAHKQTLDTLARYHRPLICTEYMARTRGSRFQNILPLLKSRHVAAINWGFVSGKTNTIYAWDTPMPDGKEPKIWFHDIFRQDGTPFSTEEIKFIRSMTKK